MFRLIYAARDLHTEHSGAIAWLEAAANRFSEILIQEELLTGAEQDLFALSVEEMKTDMRNNRVDVTNLTIDDLGVYASPRAALKLSTLHNAKGREYQGVAIIDLHEGRIPHFQAETTDDMEEAKRLFYVGVTRAKRLLLYVTDESHRRNEPTRFLGADGLALIRS